MQAKAYSEIQDPCLAVSISGDIGEARTFQVNLQDNSGEHCIPFGQVCYYYSSTNSKAFLIT